MDSKDITRLTLGEVAEIEDLTGRSIDAFTDDTAPKGKALAALYYVFKKREDKEFTFKQALEATFEDVNDFLGLDVEDPKEN